ncbi:MAG TPA: TRAP transporter small permease subunit [Acidiferrobacteraceae bacterium]|nr:TRAP transporter small permease subunit [Acidiferrobacteraceae bacterium]
MLSKFQRLAHGLDRLSELSGRAVAWVVVLMALVVGYDVAMRYLFSIGSVALQELEWHLFALIFLLGAAYTLKQGGHVRVEVLYQHFSPRAQAWADLFGTIFFLLPFCLLIIISSWPFVFNAFQYAEGSPDPGGLPYRFLLKSAIPLGFSLLVLQGFAHIIRCILFLLGKEKGTA